MRRMTTPTMMMMMRAMVSRKSPLTSQRPLWSAAAVTEAAVIEKAAQPSALPPVFHPSTHHVEGAKARRTVFQGGSGEGWDQVEEGLQRQRLKYMSERMLKQQFGVQARQYKGW